MRKKLVIISLALALLLLHLHANYVAAKPFYKGKTLRVICTSKPGGGYDAYARLLTRTMKKYLPGSTIIVKNIPGGGHIIGTNKLYFSKPNGLTIGGFERSLLVSQVAGLKGVKFDLAKMSWLGSPASDPRVLLVGQHTPYKTLDELVRSDKRVRFAATAIGTTDYMDVALISRMLGAKNWTISPGYMWSETQLAMMRGEVDAVFMSIGSARPLLKSGEVRPLMFNSDKPIKGYEAFPLLPKLVGKEYKNLIDLMLFLIKLNRPYAGPPNIPGDRLQILREAFRKSWHDPELLKTAKKMGRPINYIGPKEAENLVKSTLKQPPELVKLIREAYGVKD